MGSLCEIQHGRQKRLLLQRRLSRGVFASKKNKGISRDWPGLNINRQRRFKGQSAAQSNDVTGCSPF
jgi:hypothetical protein